MTLRRIVVSSFASHFAQIVSLRTVETSVFIVDGCFECSMDYLLLTQTLANVTVLRKTLTFFKLCSSKPQLSWRVVDANQQCTNLCTPQTWVLFHIKLDTN